MKKSEVFALMFVFIIQFLILRLFFLDETEVYINYIDCKNEFKPFYGTYMGVVVIIWQLCTIQVLYKIGLAIYNYLD